MGGLENTHFSSLESVSKTNRSFGLFFQIELRENILILPHLTFGRKSSSIKNIKGDYSRFEYIGPDYEEFVYKRFYDLDFEGSFIDFGLMTNYKVVDLGDVTFQFGMGFGYSLAVSDYSSEKNSIQTTDLIKYIPKSDPIYEGYPVDLTFTSENSGYYFSGNLMFNYKFLHILPIYKVYLYDMKDMVYKVEKIGAFNSFQILIGIGI